MCSVKRYNISQKPHPHHTVILVSNFDPLITVIPEIVVKSNQTIEVFQSI